MSEKKVRLRMGIHNRVTRDRWQAIKDDTERGIPVAKIAKRHSVSESTVRKVRKSRNFNEYRVRNDKQIQKGPVVVVAPSCGVPFEDFGKKPLFFSPKKVKPSYRELSNQLDREAEDTARCLGTVMIVGVIALALVIVFIFALVGGNK